MKVKCISPLKPLFCSGWCLVLVAGLLWNTQQQSNHAALLGHNPQLISMHQNDLTQSWLAGFMWTTSKATSVTYFPLKGKHYDALLWLRMLSLSQHKGGTHFKEMILKNTLLIFAYCWLYLYRPVPPLLYYASYYSTCAERIFIRYTYTNQCNCCYPCSFSNCASWLT